MNSFSHISSLKPGRDARLKGDDVGLTGAEYLFRLPLFKKMLFLDN